MSNLATRQPGKTARGPACHVLPALAVILALVGSRPGTACTAFVMKNGGVVLLAKNLDGPVSDAYVFVNKRQVLKEAFGQDDSRRLRWTSKYGSVTFNQFGQEFPFGGINERGLVIESLDGPAEYPSSGDRSPLNELQWIQYQLDNHSSVKDVLKSEARLQISKLLLDLHFLVADRSGKTAVIEFSGGRMVSYAGNDLPVRVLTNASYAASVRYLKMHKGFGGERTVSKGLESTDRFVRAATILEDFDWPVQGVLSDHAFTVLRSLEQADTQWSVVYNIPRRLVFFKTRDHRRLKIISLDALDFSCATPVLMLPVNTEAGWVLTGNFEPYNSQKNRLLLETVFRKLGNLGGTARISEADIVRRMSEYPGTCRCR